jgi:hypothetical protein
MENLILPIIAMVSVFLGIPILIVIVTALIATPIVNKQARANAERQQHIKSDLVNWLESNGFHFQDMDRDIVHIKMPRKRYILSADNVPAVHCFLCIDRLAKRWCISQIGGQPSKIYSFSDLDVIYPIETDETQPGNMEYNAWKGYSIGHSVSDEAAFLGMMIGILQTKRYGKVKNITASIRIKNDYSSITIPILRAPLTGYRVDKGFEMFIRPYIDNLYRELYYIKTHS